MIDDDPKLCGLVRDYLSGMGYEVEIQHSPLLGREAAVEGDFDAVLLDVMMPELDGFEVLKWIRARSDVPVLMLTARGDEADRIVGLEIGADDYLPKTFSPRELLARLRAVMRRSRAVEREQEPSAEILFPPLRILTDSHTVLLDENKVELTPLEYDLLLCLARSPGKVRTRDQLMDEIAGRDYQVFDRSIDVHVSSLRRKLQDPPKEPRFIKTIRTVGYLFLREPES